MSIVGRKVKKLRTHTPIHFEGLGTVGQTVTETHRQIKDLVITIVSPEGLISVTSNSAKLEGLVYPANVIEVELKPEETKPEEK